MIGYCQWSLLVNFERRRGYIRQLAPHAFDPRMSQRTAKPSARSYDAIVAAPR